MESNKTLSVTDANRYIKSLIEQDILLSRLLVSGEISNLKHYSIGGQIYFTLKDENSQLNCVIFDSTARQIKFALENGMKVNILGRVSVFEKKGYYNLQVFAIEPIGIGPLAQAFEQLKQKLHALGLFSPERKRPIPHYPQSIGIIASPSGAALWDIITVSRRRCPYVKIYLYPAIVQGEKAPESLIKAISLANRHKKADLLMLARGGGSLEELFCFNDEKLAYAIAESGIPVISAVGHEVDFTIADFVADMRAPTPSAGAEMVFRDVRELFERVANLEERIKIRMLDLVEEMRLLIDDHLAELNDLMKSVVDRNNQELRHLSMKLEALNPLAVLGRGYSVASIDGRIIRKISDCSLGDAMTTQLADGHVRARIYQISHNKKITADSNDVTNSG